MKNFLMLTPASTHLSRLTAIKMDLPLRLGQSTPLLEVSCLYTKEKRLIIDNTMVVNATLLSRCGAAKSAACEFSTHRDSHVTLPLYLYEIFLCNLQKKHVKHKSICDRRKVYRVVLQPNNIT